MLGAIQWRRSNRCIASISYALAFYVLIFGASPQAARAQEIDFDPPLEINETNKVETFTIDISNSDIDAIRVRAFDPDFPNEGALYINDQGPIDLFPGAVNDNDSQTFDFDILLTPAQKTYFVTGTNTIRVEHVQTAGFALERFTILGRLPLVRWGQTTPAIGSVIEEAKHSALLLYRRLNGVRVGIDDPIISQMADFIAGGDTLSAAQLATAEQGFLNLVVRDVAAKMSTVDETVRAPMSDFIASFIGTVRDERDARELLTGDFYYRAGADLPIPSDERDHIVSSNDHYDAIAQGFVLAEALERVDGQKLLDSSGALIEHPDPAGLLTSRAFMLAHASAGTNRRLAQYAVKAFTCLDIEEWADASSPDARVRRDVERSPGGDPLQYQTECKSCHANLDAMSGAFARYDFSDGIVKYAPLLNDDADGMDALPQDPFQIAAKMNQNAENFSGGYYTVDDSWENFALSAANQALFGWRGDSQDLASGWGVRSLGHILAQSEAFSACMVERVFEEVCRRPLTASEQTLQRTLADTFEADSYNLKHLFEQVATTTECMGL